VLEKKVDLGEYETIKPAVRDRILAEEVRIL
jgi:predicted nucleotidyltransferase